VLTCRFCTNSVFITRRSIIRILYRSDLSSRSSELVDAVE
jgi:hypothetical protein